MEEDRGGGRLSRTCGSIAARGGGVEQARPCRGARAGAPLRREGVVGRPALAALRRARREEERRELLPRGRHSASGRTRGGSEQQRADQGRWANQQQVKGCCKVSLPQISQSLSLLLIVVKQSRAAMVGHVMVRQMKRGSPARLPCALPKVPRRVRAGKSRV